MKTIHALLICIIIFLNIISCKKSPTDNSPVTPVYKLKTYTEDYFHNGTHQKDSFNLTYNANEQISLLQSTSRIGNKFVYSYDLPNSFTQDFYSNNLIRIHAVYLLKNNIIDSFTQNSNGDTTTTKFIYNSMNQIVTMKEYYYTKNAGSELFNTTSYTYDASGNMIKQTNTEGYVYDYTYISNQPDRIEFMLPYFKYATNLVSTEKISNHGIIINITHTYIFDTQNRVSIDKQVYDNGDLVVKSYTYY